MKFNTALLAIVLIQLIHSNVCTRYCGKRLIHVLGKLCRHRYHFSTSDVKQMGVYAQRSHNGHGIVDECCHRSCTVSTLMKYCENPDQLPSSTMANLITTTPLTNDSNRLRTFSSILHLFQYVGEVMENDENEERRSNIDSNNLANESSQILKT